MMERRQMWLEEQFLQQGKDLLRLSRQIHVIQDFITLHFDSFRDYSMERERSDMRLDDKGNSGESGPGGNNRYSHGLQRSLSPYPPNAMHSVPYCTPPIVTTDQNGHYESQGMLQQLDNPVDLSEYPSSSDFVPHQRPISPLDLSVSSSNWDNSYNKNHPEDEPLRNLAHHQSPSPILSRSSLPHDVTPEGFQFKSEVEVSDRETSEEDNDVTYPHSSSSRNSLHPNSSSYDSVLRSILRTDPPISAKIKYEQMNANLPVRSYESSQLHWSSGTVTSSAAAASTSIQSPGYLGTANYNNNEESESGNMIGGGAGVMTIKREDSALDYERHGRTACLVNDELGRILPSADSAIISKSEPEDYSLTKMKGRKPKRPKSSTSSSKTLSPAKPKKPKSTRQGRNTSTPNSGGTVESSSSSGQGSKKCRFCGKTFQWSHSVKTHERLHTGDKPYLCKMCGTRFTQNGNLKVHAKTCVGKYADMYKSKNIFVCPLCTEMFQNMDELMAHQKSHDRMQWSDKDKTCRFCGKMFQKRSLLLTHELVHTNNQEDEEDMNENDSISEGGRSKHEIIRFDGNSNTGSSGGGGGGGVGGKVSLIDNHGISCLKADIPTLHNGTMVPCSNVSADGNNPDDDSFADDSD